VSRAQRAILILAIALGVGHAWLRGAFVAEGAAAEERAPIAVARSSIATFALGCFWSAESAFAGMPGVLAVTSGYTGGTEPNPTYQQVSSGATGHAEAVEVRFDPIKVTFTQLLDRFWHEVDPFTAHKQFCDLGDQYRPAVFVHGAEQRDAALASRRHWEEHFGRPVTVAVEDAGRFFAAESYHQDYASRHPIQYRYYRWACGRDARLRQIWQ
jgi:peptide-methionine (S)-S-oxide reductase